MDELGRGDRAALGELFRRHHDKVYRLCWRVVGPEHAEDLAQDAFLRVLRYGRSFGRRSQFTTWLYRVARNVCLDHIARTGRDETMRSAYANEVRATGEEDDSVEAARVVEALRRLPVAQREVLVLSRFHDLPYAEIAEICRCSVGAVKVRVHRALQRLRTVYEEIEREHDVLPPRTTPHSRVARR